MPALRRARDQRQLDAIEAFNAGRASESDTMRVISNEKRAAELWRRARRNR